VNIGPKNFYSYTARISLEITLFAQVCLCMCSFIQTKRYYNFRSIDGAFQFCFAHVHTTCTWTWQHLFCVEGIL